MSKDYWRTIEPFWDQIGLPDTAEEYLGRLAWVPTPIALLHAAHWVQSEVRNGGFGQFFDNPTGVLAPEAFRGLTAMGLPECAATLSHAMEKLGTPYPRDRKERRHRLNEIEPEVFNVLDDEFLALLEEEASGFERAADSYSETIEQLRSDGVPL